MVSKCAARTHTHTHTYTHTQLSIWTARHVASDLWFHHALHNSKVCELKFMPKSVDFNASEHADACKPCATLSISAIIHEAY